MYNKMINTIALLGLWRVGSTPRVYHTLLTIEPGNGDALEEHQEQQAHSTGWVVVEELKHIQTTLDKDKGKNRKNERETERVTGKDKKRCWVLLYCTKQV